MPDYWAAFEAPDGEKLANRNIEFFQYESRIQADFEGLKRQRARRAALYNEVAEAFKNVFGAVDFDKVAAFITERKDSERRIEIVAAWLEHSGKLNGLPIRDLRKAVISDVFALPPEVQSLVVACAQLLPEDRAPEVLKLYWKDSQFEAPEVTEAEKKRIQERHTVFATGAAAYRAGEIFHALIFAINRVNRRHPEHRLPFHKIGEALPFMAPFVAQGPGEELVFNPDNCLFETGDGKPLKDEVLGLHVPAHLQHLFTDEIDDNGPTAQP
ncbi:MAG TPA: hypothetical protein PLZ12_09945 [Saprospiraceae bacterium]|nr:hypothetical protein [Saprospiraceae bacterium]